MKVGIEKFSVIIDCDEAFVPTRRYAIVGD
jgi:hypothetical protein